MNDFVVFPWNRRFLPALLDFALETCGGDPGKMLFVFPHARPARYMRELLRDHPAIKRPCLLPEMLPVSSLFSAMRAASGGNLPISAGLLDQVGLLLECVRALPKNDDETGGAIPLDDPPRRFFPWGMRLARLMEEFFTHNVTPSDYAHMEGEVSPFAAALLARLSGIHRLYLAALEKRGWTTPGLDARHAARHPELALDVARRAAGGRRVFLAGFHTLNGSEEAVFRRLCADPHHGHDSYVCLHADPAVVPGGARKSPHWSCNPLIRWASRWGAGLVPAPGCDVHAESEAPTVRFVAGFDLHSQLAELQNDLETARLREGTLDDTAIALPEASLLMPVLHHLPDVPVNISMGYPLSRSPLFRLLESILEAQESAVPRHAPGGAGPEGAGPEEGETENSVLYHWKTAVALLRHPYLKMLEPAAGPDKEGDAPGTTDDPGDPGLRRLLHRLEDKLRHGKRYVDLAPLGRELLAELPPEELPPPLAELFLELLDAVFFRWQNRDSAASLAGALENTAALLLRHGQKLWPRFPIDAECLYRLMQSVIPQLARSELADQTLDPPVLFMMLRRLLDAERAPFEADPLVGLQVMGMLETRLLSFERVFLLDATEDRIPGTPAQDPLLPDSLRALAHLPDARGRTRVAAYNFFRLMAGAREIVLYWQEGVEPQGLADGKKLRSRFVEEMLWEREKQARELFSPGQGPEKHGGGHGPLRMLSCSLPPLPVGMRAIPQSPASRESMRELVARGLSPSLLDAYLRCPARFFHERIGKLRGVDSVGEGDDPRGLGTLLHDVLQQYFEPRLDRPILAELDEKKALARYFHTALAGSELAASLPPDSLLMLEESGPERLGRLLAMQEGCVPLRLEEELSAEFPVRGRMRVLKGVLDRVDERDGKIVILDYKTGSLQRPDPDIWTDDAFWERLETALAPGPAPDADAGAGGSAPDPALFEEIAARVKSVQLPSYLFLHAEGAGIDAFDAAYVELGDKADEIFLFAEKTPDEAREAAVTRIPLLLEAIVRHMEESDAYVPRPGPHCDWCLYKYSCMVLAGDESGTLIPRDSA